MFDPMSTYRSTQVASSSRLGQVVLLYQGAIRYGTQHVARLGQGDLEAAHHASIRCQEIVSALRETLDLSAGAVAANLDSLYDYVLRRLVAGNIAKEPGPTEEALSILRDLLEAWKSIEEPAAAPVALARPAQPQALEGIRGF